MTKKTAKAGLFAAVFAASIGTTMILPATAQAGTSCAGGTGSGRCVETTNEVVGEEVVESVPLQNPSSQAATLTCSFSQTIAKSIDTSVSVEASVTGQIFGAVSATASVGVSQSVSQSASQTTSAGGTVDLAPGQSVVCQRIYSYVQANVHQYDYSGTGTSNVKDYTTTVPSSLGVRIIDG